MRLLVAAFQVLFFLGLIGVSLIAAGIISNRLPLSDPPGLGERLKTYLTTHVAETTADSPFPELRLRHYRTPPALLFDIARRAVEGLRWEIAVLDSEKKEIQAVATTKVWRFKDDITIRVEPAPEGGSFLYARSSSRVGRGDLGANTRHIMDLLLAAERLLPPGSLPSKEPPKVPQPALPSEGE